MWLMAPASPSKKPPLKTMVFEMFKQKSPAEQLRENKRMLDRSIRELERERMTIEGQVKKTMAEMKKMAKAGQDDVVKMMAKDVVRMRGQITKFYKMRAQMQSASMQMQTMKSQQTMAKAMAGVTRSLQVMNAQMNMPAMQKMMMEYEKQSELMEFKQEMMDDAMDDVFEAEGEEEKTEEMVSAILDEVGINLAGGLGSVPATAAKSPVAKEAEEDDLQARLEMLRGAK